MMLLIAERYRSSGQPKTERVNGWRASQRATQSHAIPGNRGDVNKRRRATSNSTSFFLRCRRRQSLRGWREEGEGWVDWLGFYTCMKGETGGEVAGGQVSVRGLRARVEVLAD